MSAAAIVRISARVEDIGTPGQRPGTTTNDNASAGNVGEFMQGMTDASTAATFTVTIASPAVVTQAGHNYTSTGTGIFVPTTTGALPTGLTAGTVYYVIPTTVSGNTFQLATSIANAFAGTAVNTSGSQSGTHTGSAFRSLTNNTQADLAAVQLTAGDWMLSGSAYYVAANTTTTSYVSVGIGTASATLPSQQVYVNQFQVTFPSTGPANSPISPTRRISVASGATQIAYLVGLVGFGVSTYTGGGQISAWRIR